MNRAHGLSNGNSRECNQEKGSRFHLACNDNAMPFRKSALFRELNRSDFGHLTKKETDMARNKHSTFPHLARFHSPLGQSPPHSLPHQPR